MMKRNLVLSALLALAATAVRADDATAVLEAEVAALRAEVEALRAEVGATKPSPVQVSYEDGVLFTASNATMKIGGYAQFDGRVVDSDAGTDSAFLVRRVRPELKGTLPGTVNYKLQGDFSGSTAKLIEGWMETPLVGSARFRAGQYKEPFSVEEMTSSAWIDFVERSMIVSAFAPQEDIGAGLGGSLWEKRIRYDAGVFNGRGKNVDENNNDKDVAGRIAVSPWISEKGSLLQGLTVGVNATAGEQDEDMSDTSYRSAGRTKFYSYTKGVATDGERTRFGTDVTWIKGPGSIKAEWITIDQDDLSLGSTNANVSFDGWYIAGTWLLTGETMVAGKAIEPAKGPVPGAVEATARYESFEGGEDALDVGLATGSSKADAATVGLTWYPSRNIRVMGNVIHVEYDDEIKVKDEKIDSEDILLVRLQYAL